MIPELLLGAYATFLLAALIWSASRHGMEIADLNRWQDPNLPYRVTHAFRTLRTNR